MEMHYFYDLIILLISFEILCENLPNMGKEIVSQVQEAQRDPGRINPRRNTP